jgi:hypothetical protein
MIGMVGIFLVLIGAIALVYNAWSACSKEERVFVLKALFKGVVFAFIAFTILFVVVNLF